MLTRIKKYLRLTRRRTVITQRQDHTVSRTLIDPNALKVLNRLNQAGYTAYLVGGGVRDLLLGRKPKDFDVSTDAHPHQIKELFRNCMLIGRRFRLAHIRFRDMIIETSTFRCPGSHDPDAEADTHGRHAKHKRTNTFGTPEEDAQMRDFTINGLFYDIKNFTVIDHVGGQKDLERKLIRCIGEPRLRFPEDPVRMLRAIRFAARLGFSIEKKTLRAIVKHRAELKNAAPARLIEEIYRFFGFGTGQAAFRLLEETKILPILLPALDAHLRDAPASSPSLWKYLEAFDGMQPNADVQRETAILAALAYPLFEARLQQTAGPNSPYSIRNWPGTFCGIFWETCPCPAGSLTAWHARLTPSAVLKIQRGVFQKNALCCRAPFRRLFLSVKSFCGPTGKTPVSSTDGSVSDSSF